MQEVVATTSDNIANETAVAMKIAGEKEVKKVLDVKKVTEKIATTAQQTLQADELAIVTDEKDVIEL